MQALSTNGTSNLNRGLLGSLALFTFLSVTLWGGLPQAAPANNRNDALKRGEMLAKENCSSCHAVGVKGESPNPKAPAFRTLSQRYQLDALEEALGEGITMGHGEANMPHFIFEPDDIGDLIAYLKKINRR